MKRVITTAIITLSILLGLALWSVGRGAKAKTIPAAAVVAATYPLNPIRFTSLGASPFTSAGTYVIDASMDNPAPILSGPGIATPLAGVFFSPSGGTVARDEIAVFTFNSLNIPADVLIGHAANANSRPVALLSRSNATIDGTINFGGSNGPRPVGGTSSNGGNAGPGGGGGGGSQLQILVGDGGLGFVNGQRGYPHNRGGDGGSVAAGGGGIGSGNSGGGAFGGNGGDGEGSNNGGTAYGDLSLALQGGSGGAGGGSNFAATPSAGGGGGGAVEIGAVGNITLGGIVQANGGAASGAIREGGGGAGGGILIHAPTVSLTGSLNAIGGGAINHGGGGGGGRVLILTADGTLASGSLAANVDISGSARAGASGVKELGIGVFNQAPVAHCRSVTVTTGAACTANASIDNGSSDPDSDDTLTLTQSPPGPYSIGTTTVTLTVTDLSGAASSCTATVTVTNPPPTLTYAANPGTVYGTGLTINPLIGPTDNGSGINIALVAPPGGITVNNAGVVTVANNVPAGTYPLTVRATDNCGASTNASFTLGIVRANPVITWSNPADIVYGTALSATQLNATANVEGSFSYSPASSTRLNAGQGQTLSGTFTPTDTTNYTNANKAVLLNVQKATPVLTWNPPGVLVAGATLASVELNAMANVAGLFSYTPPAGTLLTAGALLLTANFTPTDTGNYVATNKSVTVSVLDNCGITVNPATLPAATKGVPFVQTLSAAPTGSYVFSLLSGQLPPGISLINTLGIYSLRGTPTTSGSYTFTIKAKKNNSTCEGARTYTVVVP